MLSKILLIPNAGWDGEKPSRGVTIPSIAEAEVVDLYIHGICEELDLANVVWDILPTRKRPGLSEDQRLSAIDPGCLGVILAVGSSSDKSKATRNFSTIHHSPGLSYAAGIILEALTDWGTLSVFGHGSKRLNEVSAWGERAVLKVDPFNLDGPSSQDYLKRLYELGRDLGRSLGYVLLEQNPKAKKALYSLPEKPKKTVQVY